MQTLMQKLRALYPMLLVAMAVSLTITALVTWLNIGWRDDFVSHWLHAAGLAVAVMLPLGGLIMALVSRTVDSAFAGRPPWVRRLIASLGMGLAMEAIASGIATAVNVGLGANTPAVWLHAYLRALPLGLCIGVFMGFVMRPWIQQRLARAGGPAPRISPELNPT